MSKKYKRVLLKVSGEFLGGESKTGIDGNVLNDLCSKIKILIAKGVEVGIVVGGGNFWRGRDSKQLNNVAADYIGMMATIMNSLALKDVFQNMGVEAVIASSVNVAEVISPIAFLDTIKCLEEGKVVIYAGGTGNPCFSTDTAAVLRGIEINADVILMGKVIDAVYSSDPKIDKTAIRYDDITYDKILQDDLKVIDDMAALMALKHNKTMLLFSIKDTDNIIKVIDGEKIGTIIHN